ncbi:MAG: transcription termination/antitermination NusG family protein [[Clostridium] innocuum]
MKWYVLYVMTGKELEIAATLNKLHLHALVPTMTKIIRSGGTWNEKEAVIFESYVFLECDFCAKTWYKVANIPGVIRWLGDKKEPSTLTYLEAEWIRLLGNEGKAIAPAEISVKDGKYEIASGVLKMFKHHITTFKKRQKTVIVSIPICGEAKEITLYANYNENETGETGVVDSSPPNAAADT